MAIDNNSPGDGVAVTSERPAMLTAGLETVFTVRLYLHERGSPSEADRLVGQLSVPVRDMLELCGLGIYQTWFLLDTSGPSNDNVEPRQRSEKFRQAWLDVVIASP